MECTIEERIAELAGLLPMFIGVLTEGSVISIPIKLNITEEKTLMILHKNEGDPMTEYSKKLALSKGSFTTVADHLEKKGLVKRVSAWDDRRKCALMLTDEGKKIARKLDVDFNRHISKKVSKLKDEDIENLHRALETIVVTMEKLKERKE